MRLLATLALGIFLNISAASQTGWISGKIVSVLDGETVVFASSTGSKSTIRIAGIDAPESGQAFFNESTAALSSLVVGKDVQVNTVMIDGADRFVAKVLVDKNDVGLLQIKTGFAWHRKSKLIEVTIAEYNQYSKAQLEAAKAKIGLWQQDAVDPADWKTQPQVIGPQVIARPKQKEVFIGVIGHNLYYRSECDEVTGLPQRVFESEEDAVAAGYKRASKCSPRTQPLLPEANSSGFPSAIRTLRAIRIIQVTSDYSSYAEKIVTFEGEIKMSSYFVGGVDLIEDQVYAFSISDGTDSVMAYTPKTSETAARLRNRLLKTYGASSRAKVQIQILGRSGGTVYGKLVNFVLYQ